MLECDASAGYLVLKLETAVAGERVVLELIV